MAAIFNGGPARVVGVAATATASVVAGCIFILHEAGTLRPAGRAAESVAAAATLPSAAAPAASPKLVPVPPPALPEASKPAPAEPPRAQPVLVTPQPTQPMARQPAPAPQPPPAEPTHPSPSPPQTSGRAPETAPADAAPLAPSPPAATQAPSPTPPQRADSPSASPAAAPSPPVGQTAAAVPEPPRPLPAEFDVVRVEPSGAAVVAGRAAPGVRVALLDGNREIAAAVTDATGHFVFLPAPFDPGDHVLQLQVTDAGGTSVSAESVTVAVPPAGEGQVTITLAKPGRAPAVLQGGAAAPLAPARPPIAPPKPAPEPPAAPTAPERSAAPQPETSVAPVAPIRHPAGATGRSPPIVCRAPVARARAAAAPRLNRPARAAVRTAPGPPPAPRMPPPRIAVSGRGTLGHIVQAARAVVPAIRIEVVRPGDSLWSISQSLYGEGLRFVEILQANAAQIRDPGIIYPGQTLVVPHKASPNR